MFSVFCRLVYDVDLVGLETGGGFGVDGILPSPLLFITVNGLSPPGGSGVLRMLLSESVLATLYRLGENVFSLQRLSGRLMMCRGRGTSILVAEWCVICTKSAPMADAGQFAGVV